MSDTQAAMREFRFLDEKRKTNGLTQPEETRWQELGAALGIDLSAGLQPTGYYGEDGLWYAYPPGYDPNAAWQQQQWAQQQYYAPQQGYYDPNTGAYYPPQQHPQYGAPAPQGYYDPNTGAYYPPEAYAPHPSDFSQQQVPYDPAQQQYAPAQQQQYKPAQQQQYDPAQQQQYDPAQQQQYDPAQQQQYDPAQQQQYDPAQQQQYDPAQHQYAPAQQQHYAPAQTAPVASSWQPQTPHEAPARAWQEPPASAALAAPLATPVFVPFAFPTKPAAIVAEVQPPIEVGEVGAEDVMEITDEEVVEVPAPSTTAPPSPMSAHPPVALLASVDTLPGAPLDDASPPVDSSAGFAASLQDLPVIETEQASPPAPSFMPSLDDLPVSEPSAESGLAPDALPDLAVDLGEVSPSRESEFSEKLSFEPTAAAVPEPVALPPVAISSEPAAASWDAPIEVAPTPSAPSWDAPIEDSAEVPPLAGAGGAEPSVVVTDVAPAPVAAFDFPSVEVEPEPAAAAPAESWEAAPIEVEQEPQSSSALEPAAAAWEAQSIAVEEAPTSPAVLEAQPAIESEPPAPWQTQPAEASVIVEPELASASPAVPWQAQPAEASVIVEPEPAFTPPAEPPTVVEPKPAPTSPVGWEVEAPAPEVPLESWDTPIAEEQALSAPPSAPEEVFLEATLEPPEAELSLSTPVSPASGSSAFDMLAMSPELAPRIPTFPRQTESPPLALGPPPPPQPSTPPSVAAPGPFAQSWEEEGTAPDLKADATEATTLTSNPDSLSSGSVSDAPVEADVGEFVVESASAAALATNVPETGPSSFDDGKLELASNSDFIDHQELTGTGAAWNDTRNSIPLEGEEDGEVIQGMVLEEEEPAPPPQRADSWGAAVSQPSPAPVAVEPPAPPAPVAFVVPPLGEGAPALQTRVAVPVSAPTGSVRQSALPISAPPSAATQSVVPLAGPGAAAPSFTAVGSSVQPVHVPGEHRVILHTVEGQVKRGAIKDATLGEAQLQLQLANGGMERLPCERVKALFFMLAPGARAPSTEGNKVRVTFKDGRQVAGFSQDHKGAHSGFFVVPADNRTNTERIFIFRHAVQSISVDS